jgi:hypothetical protein
VNQKAAVQKIPGHTTPMAAKKVNIPSTAFIEHSIPTTGIQTNLVITAVNVDGY